MCYSAQVIQMARKLNRQLGIRLDYDEIEKLFFRRIEDPSINISRGFEANFDDPVTDQERRIKRAIDEHRSRVASKMEKDLFTQKTRLVNAQRSLSTKETKKAREDVRIATAKIDMLSAKLGRLRSSEPNDEDDRIFPFVYAGVIIKKDGQNLLAPCVTTAGRRGRPHSLTGNFLGSITPGATTWRSSGAGSSAPTTPSSWSRALMKTSSVTRWNIEH